MKRNNATSRGNLADRKKLSFRIREFFCRYWMLHLMVLPGLLYFLVFKYVPMYGLTIAFKNYKGAVGRIGDLQRAKCRVKEFRNLFHLHTVYKTAAQYPDVKLSAADICIPGADYPGHFAQRSPNPVV